MSHQDRVFFSTFIGVLGFLVVLAIVFYIVADRVSGDGIIDATLDAQAQQALQERISPVGEVAVAASGATSASSGAAAVRDGASIVTANCAGCHAAGVAGAPKLGDQKAWEQRLAKGFDNIVQSAINGLGAMPPKGTCADCSADEIKLAIVSMLEQSSVQVPDAAKAAVAATSTPAVASAPATDAATPSPAAANAPTTAMTDAAPAPAAASGKGQEIYTASCSACHSTGVAGAPKPGDKAAWAPHIAKGSDVLVKNAITGINAMPPKGTCMTCSEADIAAAIDYMVSQSR